MTNVAGMKLLFHFTFAVFFSLATLGLATANSKRTDSKFIDSLLTVAADAVSPNVGLSICADALRLSQEINYHKGISDTYRIIGKLNAFNRDYRQAFSFATKSLKLAKEQNDSIGIGKCEAVLGIIFFEVGDFSRAFEYHKNSFEYFKKSENLEYISICLTNISECLVKLNRLKEADEYLNVLMGYYPKMSETNDYYFSLAHTNRDRGLIYLKQDSIDLAEKCFHNAISFSAKGTKYRLKRVEIQATLFLSQVALIKKNKKAALSFLYSALELAKTLKEPSIAQSVYKKLADYYFDDANYRQASILLKEYQNLNDSIQDIHNRDQEEFILQMEGISNLVNQLEDEQLIKAEIIKRRQWQLLASFFLVLILIATLIIYRRSNKRKSRELALILSNLEYRALKTQMNPHFIFNAINSIQSLITASNNIESLRYISKFSKLLRSVLENSEKNLIPLEAELKNLRLYIELEHLRLNYRLDYEILVSEDIIPENEHVPPLILQPFVENSIWHGFPQKVGEKKLKINVHAKKDILYCEIIDNGIGRKNSETMKRMRKPSDSKGVSITKKRLDILNRGLVNDSLNFEDLVEGDGKASGTKVTLKIKRTYAVPQK